MSVSDTIREALSRALAEVGITAAPEVIPLEFPAEIERGDYASGVAMKYFAFLRKEAKKEHNLEHANQVQVSVSGGAVGETDFVAQSPVDFAKGLVRILGTIQGVSKIEIAGPGFINFTLAPDTLAHAIESACSGKSVAPSLLSGKQILLEYTSPNLFKPLHIGNLVGNIIGESLARLMQCVGADVKRINYPSDIGLTVAKGVWGLTQTGGDPKDIQALGEAYRMGNDGYDNDSIAKSAIEEINKKLYEDSDPELSRLRREGIETSRSHLDALCEKLGTAFDLEIFESEAAPTGLAIALEHTDVFPLSEGARVFHGSHTRVFVNSKGLPTYEAKDLGNFVIKRQRFPHWDSYVVVTGSEQKDYFAVLYEAIRAIFPETKNKELRHVPTGFLTLTTGKMSSRKGNVLTGESLLEDLGTSAKERAEQSRADDKNALAEQVAVAAIKYEVLKSGTGKNIVFDKERALSLEGDSGPYLQYAHARCNAILEKSKHQDIEQKYGGLTSVLGNELARLVHRFPEIVSAAVHEMEPHVITTYLIQLAGAFNSWYAQEQILDGTPAAAHKLAVVDAVRATLKNGLWLLGIPAPEKM